MTYVKVHKVEVWSFQSLFLKVKKALRFLSPTKNLVLNTVTLNPDLGLPNRVLI